MTPEERKQVLRERKERGFPLHAPPHFTGVGGFFLISAACYEHQHIFDSPELLSYLMDETLEGFAKSRLEYPAWVFLPNHYHLLVETPDLAIVSEVLRKSHSRIATKVNYLQGKKGRKVWYHFNDRFIRNEWHYWATINYVHYNPVKHEYVERMSDWPWSSVHGHEDTMGMEKLREIWKQYPVRDYGKGWDW